MLGSRQISAMITQGLTLGLPDETPRSIPIPTRRYEAPCYLVVLGRLDGSKPGRVSPGWLLVDARSGGVAAYAGLGLARAFPIVGAEALDVQPEEPLSTPANGSRAVLKEHLDRMCLAFLAEQPGEPELRSSVDSALSTYFRGGIRAVSEAVCADFWKWIRA